MKKAVGKLGCTILLFDVVRAQQAVGAPLKQLGTQGKLRLNTQVWRNQEGRLHCNICMFAFMFVCLTIYEAIGLCLPCVLPLDVTLDGFVLLVVLHNINVLWVIVECA